MLLALLVVAQVRSIEVLPIPATFAVDAQRETVTISVQPPEGVTVRWIVMDLPDSRSWTKPTRSESLAKNGVRATFRHPHAPYAFVVPLDDGTLYRVTLTAAGRLDVLLQHHERRPTGRT